MVLEKTPRPRGGEKQWQSRIAPTMTAIASFKMAMESPQGMKPIAAVIAQKPEFRATRKNVDVVTKNADNPSGA